MPTMSALSWQLRRTVVVATAVLLSATALGPIFNSIWGWLLPVTGGIIAVAGSAAFARLIRVPLWLQPAVMVVGLTIYSILVLVRTGNLFGVIPTQESVEALAMQIRSGFIDIVTQSTPAPPTNGLVLLTTIGVGLVAIFADAVAVGMRRPALAGLPMLALYAIPVSVTGSALPWPLFVIGAAGYLWLISTDHRDRIRGWGRMMRPARQSADPAAEPASTPIGAAGRRIGLIGIAVAVLVPLVIPSLPATNLAGLVNGSGFGAPGGKSKTTLINPIADLKGRLTLGTDTEMLQLRTNVSNPRSSYLRLATLDKFDQTGWQASQLEISTQSRVSNGIPADPSIIKSPTNQQVKSSVKITGLTGSQYLPVYPNPSQISVDGDWRYEQRSGTVLNPNPGGKTGSDLNYQFTSTQVDFSVARLEAAPPLPSTDPVMRQYGKLASIPFVQSLVARIIKGKSTEFDKARALDNYFGTSDFVYDLQTRPGNSGSDLVDFLKNKHGYCEQYAAAMAYMARLAGLPSRVAIGFTSGHKNNNGSYSIKSHDAHAWVEIYFSGLGWVPFDPTPSDPNNTREALPWTQPDTSLPGNGGDTSDPTPTASPSASAGANQGHQHDDPNDPGATGLTDSNTGIPPAVWWTLGVVLTALLLLLFPSVLRGRIRRRRMAVVRAGKPTTAAHAGWDEVLDTATDLLYPLDVSETPRGTAVRLETDAKLDTSGAAAINLLATAEEQARYAPAAPPVTGLDAATTTVRKQLRASVGKRRRLRAGLMPVSALAALSERSSHWSESVSERIWNARRAVSRLFHPRTAAKP
jgi:transglutaminase-like putative cysteine protease